MEVNINEIVSNINVVDDNSLLSPPVLQKIVQIVLEALRENEEHRMRIRAEQQVTRGVSHELRGYNEI